MENKNKNNNYTKVNEEAGKNTIPKYIWIVCLILIVAPTIGTILSLIGFFAGNILDDAVPKELSEPLSIGITIILALIIYIFWFKFGRDDLVTPIVTFEPPKNTNSAVLEVNCYGCSSDRGVKSLVYYLSSKDYLKIEKSDDNYVLKKLKPYDGNDEAEELFFNGIFDKDVETVDLNKLLASNSFYLLCVNIQKLLNKNNKENMIDSGQILSRITIMLICNLGIGISILYTLSDYSFKFIFTPYTLYFLLTFGAIWLAVHFCCNYAQMKSSLRISDVNKKTVENLKKHREIYTLIFIIANSVVVGGLPFGLVAPYDVIKYTHPVQAIFGLACFITGFICITNMPKLNRKGRELRGLALGFKRFLEITEKRRFEELIEQNPNYAREVYPYAFALGITESYINDLDVLAASQSYSGDNMGTKNIEEVYNLLNKNGVNR